MKLTVVLAVLIGMLVLACSTAAPAPVEPTPNIDATVEAQGCPRGEVDVELLRELRSKGYGYKRIAGACTRATGQYISYTTARERLVEG